MRLLTSLVICVALLATTAYAGRAIVGTLENAGAINKLKFTIENVSPGTVHILNWGSPFEKVISAPIFSVNGKEVTENYIGPTVSRTIDAVDKGSIITLKAGEKKSHVFDIAKTYNLKAGTHEVSPVFNIIQVEPNPNAKEVARNQKELGLIGYKIVAQHELSAGFAIKVDVSGDPKDKSKLTSEQLLADNGKNKGKGKGPDNKKSKSVFMQLASRTRTRTTDPALHANCQADVFVANKVNTAIADAKVKLTTVRNYMGLNCAPDALYTTYFGTNTRATVKGVYDNADTLINGNTVTIDCSNKTGSDTFSASFKMIGSVAPATFTVPHDCTPSTHAYVYREMVNPVVYLCPLWFNLHATAGPTEWNRAGVLVHEFSHYGHLVGTDVIDQPVGYGDANARALSNAKKLLNAENYMIYSDKALNACPP